MHDESRRGQDGLIEHAIYQISEAANKAKSLDKLFKLVHEILSQLLHANNLYIALYDAKTSTISFPYYIDEIDVYPSHYIGPQKCGNTLTSYLIRKGVPMLMNKKEIEGLVKQGEIDQLIGPLSLEWLGVPLIDSQNQTFGAIAVQTYDKTIHYTQKDKEILSFVSAQIAMAIKIKQAEEAKLESEIKYKALFENMLSALVYFKVLYDNYGNPYDCVFGEVNTFFEKLFHVKREDLVGKALIEVPETADMIGIEFIEQYKELSQKKETKLVERYVPELERWLNISSFMPAEGYFALNIKDVTPRKEYEADISRYIEELQYNKDVMEQNASEFALLNAKLSESEQKLEELNANKDKFFSIIAHDLKSPFNSLLGFSEILVNDLDELNAEQIRRFVGNIYKSTKSIYNLLENLLEWARLQTGRIEYLPMNFSLYELATEMTDIYLINATKKAISIDNIISKDCRVFADRNMIDTVLRNLISNAIKFTDSGGHIRLESLVHDNFVSVRVSDSGVGIREENISKLFRIEEHFSTDGTAKEKGTGLGLILCKDFIELNGGKIWVESQFGHGTTFIFTLPLAQPAKQS